MANSKKRRKIVVFVLLGLGLAGLVAWTLLAKREPVITVQTEKVARRTLTEIVVANGRIQPVLEVKISPEVSGEIIELPVKEGQSVAKGDLLVRIKPDMYVASRDSGRASYSSSVAGKQTAEADLARAEAEFKRNQELFDRKLISESVFTEVNTTYLVAKARLAQAGHQVTMAQAALDRAEEDLRKTAIYAPLEGTVARLNSRLGERVVGTAMMAGTDIMTIADLNAMEARVDIGEMDVVLIQTGQVARLEVDAFKDRKFAGYVSQIANSSKGSGLSGASQSSQEATKFEVKIRVQDRENFRPGMSVTAEIETRYRTNVLTVPIASVTARMPKTETNATARAANAQTDAAKTEVATEPLKADKKNKENAKPKEVVFVLEGDQVKMAPVKIGISDEDYWEITEGLTEGQEIVSGGYRAISRDLEDGKKIIKGPAPGAKAKL